MQLHDLRRRQIFGTKARACGFFRWTSCGVACTQKWLHAGALRSCGGEHVLL